MFLLGTHKISFDSIRRLAIECYSLTFSSISLLHLPDYEDATGKTRDAFEQLLTDKILQLAISIRTKFYQGEDHRRTSGFLENTGFLVKFSSFEESKSLPFTLKDICDKIIHASSVHLVLDPELDANFIELCGIQKVNGKPQNWTLTLFMPDVCEGILGWIDKVDDA